MGTDSSEIRRCPEEYGKSSLVNSSETGTNREILEYLQKQKNLKNFLKEYTTYGDALEKLLQPYFEFLGNLKEYVNKGEEELRESFKKIIDEGELNWNLIKVFMKEGELDNMDFETGVYSTSLQDLGTKHETCGAKLRNYLCPFKNDITSIKEFLGGNISYEVVTKFYQSRDNSEKIIEGFNKIIERLKELEIKK